MSMNAVLYSAPRQFSFTQVPKPSVGDDDVLLKVKACGVCGTDQHVHEGEFGSRFPLIPGHEVVGVVEEFGKNVKGFAVGDRCVADVSETCGDCFFCRRGQALLCENFDAHGIVLPGGFAEYITFKQNKVYKFYNMTDEEATLVEPASCALHGLDKLRPSVGCTVLLFGAGPTGLILAQLLKLNGALRVVIAANKGQKMDLARSLDAGDEYIELDRLNPEPQHDQIKEEYPYGFDIVVEATGVEKIADISLNYVRRGGTLMIYGVYEDKARVHWPPGRIFNDEITIIGSFSQVFCFPRAVEYLDSGKIRTKGMVSDVFALADFQKALDKMASRQCVKIAMKP